MSQSIEPNSFANATAVATSSVASEDYHGQFDSASRYWAPALLLLYLLIWFMWFGDTVFGESVFVFRDSAYWHMPALEWTSQQWAAGRVPLWNDYQGLGLNWVGQGTTTVFYPPAWLLAVPMGTFSSRYGLLLGLHVVLATINAYAGARQLRLSTWAALLSAIAYSWSSPVLIQHSNWPFLISAAWLPLALACTWKAIVTGRGHRLAVLALSMMILGGDPQGVYVCLLCGVVAALFFRAKQPDAKWHRALTGIWHLGVITLFTIGCSLLQLWATNESAKISTRAVSEHANNIYEAAYELRSNASSESGESESNANVQEAFFQGVARPDGSLSLQFSQTPWSVLTLLSPNIFGTWRDYNRRWEQLLPATDRPWNANLYIGLIPAILAASCFLMTIRRWVGLERQVSPEPEWTDQFLINRGVNERRNVWLQLTVLLAGLTSFGWYGTGWLAAEIGWVDLRNSSIGPSFGGLHWFLTWFAPGYSSFRYPAKIWQFAGLGLCFLAGAFWDQWRRDFVRLAHRVVFPVTLMVLFVTTISFAFVLQQDILNWIYSTTPYHVDPWLGQLRMDLAVSDVQMSLFQSIVVAILFWLIAANLRKAKKSSEENEGFTFPRMRSVATILLVAVTMLDQSIASSWQLMKTDKRCLKQIATTRSYEKEIGSIADLGKSRLLYDPVATSEHRMKEMDRKWPKQAATRPVDKLAWQAMRSMRATWMPQFHLAGNVPVLNADCTLRPAYEELLTKSVIADAKSGNSTAGKVDYFENYLRLQGVGFHFLSAPNLEMRSESQIRLHAMESMLPSVWIADDYLVVSKPSMQQRQLKRDIDRVWLSRLDSETPIEGVAGGAIRKVVILDQPLVEAPEPSASSRGNVVRYDLDENKKRATVELAVPSLVCWNFAYDPGWKCRITNLSQETIVKPALAINRLHAGVVVPPGKQEMRWEYQPDWWTWGGPLTLFSWAIWGLSWVMQFKWRHRPTAG